jgi:hypothetical protein
MDEKKKTEREKDGVADMQNTRTNRFLSLLLSTFLLCLSFKKTKTIMMKKTVTSSIHSHTVFSLSYAPSCSSFPSSPSCPARGEDRREIGGR